MIDRLQPHSPSSNSHIPVPWWALALGKPIEKAVEDAKTYVTIAIGHALSLGEGCGHTYRLYDLYKHGPDQ